MGVRNIQKVEKYIAKLEDNLIDREQRLSQTVATLERAQLNMVIKLAVMVEKRDPQMSGHVEKNKKLCLYTCQGARCHI